MTDAEIDLIAEAAQLEVRAMATTARRSLGQRFRWIEARSRERFDELLARYGRRPECQR